MAGIDQNGVARQTEILMEELRGMLDRYCHAIDACGVPLEVINDYRQFGNWMFVGFRHNANSKIHSYAQSATKDYAMMQRITDGQQRVIETLIESIARLEERIAGLESRDA